MKQPKKKPAVPGCSNWISLELRLSKCRDDPKRVVWAANRLEECQRLTILLLLLLLLLLLYTCAAAAAAVERSSAAMSVGRHPCTVNDDDRDERRLAVGLHDVALPTTPPSVVMAAAAAAAAAIAALLWSEPRVPRWNALRRRVDATMPAMTVSQRLTNTTRRQLD